MKLLTDEFSTITDTDIIKNYHPDYMNEPSNIFYILNDRNGRYHNGAYYVIEEDGFVASAGYNEYDQDTILAITRMYVSVNYRAKFYIGKYVLPTILEDTKHYSKIWITFNDYNHILYQYFVRTSQDKRTGLYAPWPDIYKQFKPIGKKTINHTEQYVVEKRNI